VSEMDYRLHRSFSYPSVFVLNVFLQKVEDHFAEGGVGEAVQSALAKQPVPVHSLCVRKMPKSGKPEELLDFEEIFKKAIMKKVREVLKEQKGLRRKKQIRKKR